MGFGEDEEILQDFLVEAGEIIEGLSEQLVDLEQRPNDKELLNAIFRGFHTVKGGAGFLQLHAMVDCCHITENLFDILRNGKRSVTSELMDVVLQALDTVTHQYRQISNREALQPADPSLIKALERLVSCEDLSEETPTDAAILDAHSIDITDDEFEGFLDAIDPPDHSTKNASASLGSAVDSNDSASGDEISEDEFESLLDKLHGPGKGPSAVKAEPKAAAPSSSKPSSPKPPTAAKKPADDDFDLFNDDAPAETSKDEITEDEFEALLDQLHGNGKAPATAKVPFVESPAPSFSTMSVGASAAGSNSRSGAANSNAGNNSSDLISDNEFEDLLDQLHGKGKGPTVISKANTESAKAAAAAKASDTKLVAVPSSNKALATPAAPSRASGVPRGNDADGGRESPRREGGAGGGASSPSETTVRVDTQRLDDIMNMVGELVLVRNRLVRLGLETSDEAMQKAVANLDVVTGDLQSAVMKTRMQPIKKVFGRFPRVVRDLARNLRKEISLELVGEETDLDKNLVEALADPLVHLVRNSVDHGIEEPDVRERSGKPREGTVTLAAEQEGDHILLSITDDGAGMDAQRLRDKAVEKGLLDVDAAARLTDVEAFNLIFAPGFSTKTEISDVSGRGVGMDVVKTKIAQLNGSIEIFSKVGQGTRFVIKVPLTLAIMPTLMIQLANQTFALPLVSVNEIFNMDLKKSNIVDGQECITIRDKAIPMYYLKDWLIQGSVREKKKKNAEGHVVIVSVGTQRVGFVVDQLIGQEEVVIKPLGRMLQGTPGMAGATITGDGTIALILDVPSMLKRYAGGHSSRVNVA